jgi:acyl-CoA synthetase (AMP-forming)/AMP-acid ligase II
MNDLPHDGVSQGEVVVRAPWLTQGYLKDPTHSETLWAGGWLHTGDIAVIDDEGYLKITDRIKDVIKTGGEWVSSLDLEGLILKHPGVVEAAVIGVPDPKWTERRWRWSSSTRATGERGRYQNSPPGFRGPRRHIEIRGPGSRRLCRRTAQNQCR